MALNPLNSSNLEQLALMVLNIHKRSSIQSLLYQTGEFLAGYKTVPTSVQSVEVRLEDSYGAWGHRQQSCEGP